ncbi:MAG: hypothetical protein ACJA04_000285 [Cellvibrionaceae bacterium]|jgi:hypothetical protein
MAFYTIWSQRLLHFDDVAARQVFLFSFEYVKDLAADFNLEQKKRLLDRLNNRFFDEGAWL